MKVLAAKTVSSLIVYTLLSVTVSSCTWINWNHACLFRIDFTFSIDASPVSSWLTRNFLVCADLILQYLLPSWILSTLNRNLTSFKGFLPIELYGQKKKKDFCCCRIWPLTQEYIIVVSQCSAHKFVAPLHSQSLRSCSCIFDFLWWAKSKGGSTIRHKC